MDCNLYDKGSAYYSGIKKYDGYENKKTKKISYTCNFTVLSNMLNREILKCRPIQQLRQD